MPLLIQFSMFSAYPPQIGNLFRPLPVALAQLPTSFIVIHSPLILASPSLLDEIWGKKVHFSHIQSGNLSKKQLAPRICPKLRNTEKIFMDIFFSVVNNSCYNSSCDITMKKHSLCPHISINVRKTISQMWSKIFNSTQYLAKFRKLSVQKQAVGEVGRGGGIKIYKSTSKCQVLYWVLLRLFHSILRVTLRSSKSLSNI